MLDILMLATLMAAPVSVDSVTDVMDPPEETASEAKKKGWEKGKGHAKKAKASEKTGKAMAKKAEAMAKKEAKKSDDDDEDDGQ